MLFVSSILSYLTDPDLPNGSCDSLLHFSLSTSSVLGLEQINVVVSRDRYGYGLTVSGDNPVYVLSVREDGAAHRAGVRVNDQIIKVNVLSA